MPHSLRTFIGPVGRWLLIAGVVLASTGIGQAPLASVASVVSRKPPAAPPLAPPPAPPLVVGPLMSVAALSPSYIWAVGSAYTERWNGRHWTSVPNPGTTADTELSGVAVTSASNAWAVGYSLRGAPVIFHWNGTRWSDVASPVKSGVLSSVAASSPRNVWAVGYLLRPGKGDCNTCRTITLHWNGSNWSKVASPDPGILQGVAVVSARSAWAVGAGPQGSLVLRWNGARWVHVASQDGAARDLTAVVALSASSAWAVGDRHTGAFAEHWNGRTWKQLTTPGGTDGALNGVSAASARDVWAVGYEGGGIAIMHWNGRSWKRFKSPPVPANAHGHGLYGVATISAKDAWAVGYYGGGCCGLFAHWNGTTWKREKR